MSIEYSIAVLLPTRGRTDSLARSVLSLVDHAADQDSIQLILGFDNDDTVGLTYFSERLQPELDRRNIAYTVMEFEPLGYARLNEYYNAMVRESSAEWVFVWNDDATIETDGWDNIINSHVGQFKLLAIHTHHDHPYSIFPIVPRAWVELAGRLSIHQMIDAELSQLAYMLDIWERIEVYATHDRHDLTGNNLDKTFKERISYEGNPSSPKDFHHISHINYRNQEADRIDAYMHSIGIGTDWWSRVKTGQQDPWAKLIINDVNHQMHQYITTLK